MKTILKLAGAGLALLIIAPAIAPAQNFQKNTSRILDVFAEVVAKPSEATARVLCDGKEVALGTIVEADGLLLTKASELTDDNPVVRLKNGKEYPGTILGVHKPYDLALIRIAAQKLPVVEWRKDAIEPGDWVVTPGAEEKPLYIGVVSVAARKVTARDMPGNPLPPANSGYLGVLLEESPAGVSITEVTSGSAAEKAGLKAKDLILTIEGKPIKDVPGMIEVVSKHKPGETITLKVMRGDEEKELTAKLDRRPGGRGPSRGDFQNNLGSELSKRKNGFPSILQHDTVVKPYDCGGPLVDINGRVVGINIARAGRVESYAVPVDAVLSILPDLKAGKFALPKEPEAIKEAPQSKK